MDNILTPEKYIEGNKNKFVHIFYEFYIFIYLLNHDSKTSVELHNILEESRRIHSRVIADFFSNKRCRKDNDDIIVSDVVMEDCAEEYHLGKDIKDKYKDVRNMINKTTAHLTSAACKNDFFPDELEAQCKEYYVDLFKQILNFTRDIDKIVKETGTLRKDLQDDYVRELIRCITSYGLDTILKNPRYFSEETQS